MKNISSLSLKYRPRSFDDLVGQEITAQTIFNSIKLNRVPNAFLFHGIRGTGKTSIARIIAKSLNCKNGVENLCNDNLCENCEGITNSNHLDIIEQDCATATGIDSVRDLIEFCRYPPTTAKYKVLILDEIQAMSKAGAQSLLKILEEPPSYVRFIFCTTEIKKILVTMLSRCTRFDLSRVKHSEMFNYLKKICEIEKGKISDDALKLICKCSEGSVRDALSLLDRAILSETSEDMLTLKEAQKIFGHFDKSQLIKLLNYILLGNENKTLEIYRSIYNAGIEPNVFLNDFLEILYYLKNISYIKIDGNNFDLNNTEYDEISKLGKQIDNKTLINFWHITLNAMDEIKIVSNQNISIEMFLLRLLYFKNIYLKNIEIPMNSKPEKKEITKTDNNTSGNEEDNSSRAINQIKNVTQDNKLEAVEEKPKMSHKIKTLDDLIEICNEKKEMNLKYELETNVNLVSFGNNIMEISFNESLNKDFVKIISSKLYEWTGDRWLITFSKKKGDISKKQKKKSNDKEIFDKFTSTEDYKEIISLFEDAELTEIDNND